MSVLQRFIILTAALFAIPAFAAPKKGKYFDRVVFVLFENTNYSAALKQPFFGQLAKQGALLSNFMAATHPSQANYIALTSGSMNGVKGDNPINLDVKNVADLLEARGITWRVYAEDYPGNCFTGKLNQGYARRHNPFISYINIQTDPERCANIVNAAQFDKDVSNGTLPEYVFYIPNNNNNGHDTGVGYADKWYGQKFSRLIVDPKFIENTILLTTFDESGVSFKNQVYTTVVGPGVQPGTYSQSLNFYSLLKMVEENWNLGDLGKMDASAEPVPDIWK